MSVIPYCLIWEFEPWREHLAFHHQNSSRFPSSTVPVTTETLDDPKRNLFCMLPTPPTPCCFFELWDQQKCYTHGSWGHPRIQAPLPPRPCQRWSAILKSASVARVVTICRLLFRYESRANRKQKALNNNTIQINSIITDHPSAVEYLPTTKKASPPRWMLMPLWHLESFIQYITNPGHCLKLPYLPISNSTQIWVSKQLAQEMVPFLNRWSWDF